MKPDQIGRRIKLRQLEILFAVAECGTMGKAAERLALTQPVISKAIAELESVLGVQLLDRGPHGAEPTLYGRILLKRSAAIFDELSQSVGEINFQADPTGGELRVGCADSMLSGFLPVVINKLCDRYPRLIFRVSQAPSGAALYRELRERNVDVVLGKVAMPPKEADLNYDFLFDEQQFVVTGPGSPWLHRRRIKLADLMNERWTLPSDSAGGAQVAEVFRACGLELPHVSVFSTSIQLYNALVAGGKFLAMLPTSVLRFAAERTLIKILAVSLPKTPWPIGVVTLKYRTISPVAQLFIDCAKETAKPVTKRQLRPLL
jgi:DNA-binding transcriptional LysR family regulator